MLVEESITNATEKSGEKTIVRDMSFLGASWGANAAMVDVKDGKIIRIRPARYYDEYTKEEIKPWVMHARGRPSSLATRASSLRSASRTRSGSTLLLASVSR